MIDLRWDLYNTTILVGQRFSKNYGSVKNCMKK